MKFTRILRGVMTVGTSFGTDKLFDKVSPGLSGKLQDPLRMIPRRPVITEYVTSSGDPGSRKKAGYNSGLMGTSRLTG